MAYQFSYTWAQIISRVINAMQKGVDYVTAGRLAGSTLGTGATAEGSNNTASGANSHAGGQYNVASGTASIAMGAATTASAGQATALGSGTTASGGGAIATGMNSEASGNQSVTLGIGTAANRRSQFAFGEYNTREEGVKNTRGQYIVIAGNGEDDTDRSNAMTLDWDGNEVLAGKLTIGTEPVEDMDVVNKSYAEQNLTVSNAKQLLGDAVSENSVPYLYRKSEAVGDREYLDKVVGGTVAWNQLLQNGNFASTSNWSLYGISLSASGNIGTLTITSAGTNNRIEQQSLNGLANHVYMVSAEINPSAAARINILDNANTEYLPITNINAGKNFIAAIGKPSADFAILRFYINRGSLLQDGATVAMQNVQLYDLTQIFGSTIAAYIYSLEQATAGAGVAFFRSLFPKPYYDYNAGELMSVNTSGHKTVGFNQFDGAWDGNTAINDAGAKYTNTSSVTSTNAIKVIGGQAYYLNRINSDKAVSRILQQYDTDMAYLGYVSVPASNPVVTLGSNVAYVYIQFNLGSGTTQADVLTMDVTFNLSSDKNGEYETYAANSYPISAIDLRGIPNLVNNKLAYDGDEYKADGTVTRKYGIVDLGTLTWTRVATGTYPFFESRDVAALIKRPPNNSTAVNVICARYIKASANDPFLGNVTNCVAAPTNGYLYVYDNAYTDPAVFKSAMSGVHLVYELATPTTETADPYQRIQITDADGTEEFIDERAVAIPVGHLTEYPADLVAEIERVMVAVPKPPTANGSYTLKVTISGGVATYSWEE